MKDNHPNKLRRRLLLIPALLLAVLILKLPLVSDWFKGRPMNYYEEFKATKLSELTENGMREIRYGKQYVLANMLVQALAKDTNVTVLLEPNSYYRENGIDMIVPEPIVFYYYTSGKMKAVWTDSKALYDAKYFIRISRNLDLSIIPLTSRAAIDTVLAEYKNYKATL